MFRGSAGREPGRPVGALALLALGVNGIVGVGIFYAPADVARGAPGLSSIWVFALTGLALIPVALCFAALGRRFDEDGGPVVYARAAFGELPAFLVGWVAYTSAVCSTAAVTSGLASGLAPSLSLHGAPLERLLAASLAVVIALVCTAGIVISARTWTALTILKLLPLLLLIGVFALAATPGVPAHGAVTPSLARAALTAAFTYQGFEVVPVIAGQVRAPARSVPFATTGSLGIATLLYVALQAACVLAVPGLATSATPLVDAAAHYGGARLATLVAWGADVSALGICVGMMVVTPRYLSTLAHDDALALSLHRMAPNGVPRRALAVTALLVGALVLAVRRNELFVLSSLAVQVQYVVSALALWSLARRGAFGLERRQAALALPAVAAGLALTLGANAGEWLVTAAFIVLGLALRSVRPAR